MARAGPAERHALPRAGPAGTCLGQTWASGAIPWPKLGQRRHALARPGRTPAGTRARTRARNRARRHPRAPAPPRAGPQRSPKRAARPHGAVLLDSAGDHPFLAPAQKMDLRFHEKESFIFHKFQTLFTNIDQIVLERPGDEPPGT